MGFFRPRFGMSAEYNRHAALCAPLPIGYQIRCYRLFGSDSNHRDLAYTRFRFTANGAARVMRRWCR